MTAEEWRIAGFTLQMAAISTLLILPPGLLLGWLLARRNWPGKSLIETLVTLPLVAARGHGPSPSSTVRAASTGWRVPRSPRHRCRLHVEGGRRRDDGHVDAAPSQSCSDSVRGGQPATRADRSDSGCLPVACSSRLPFRWRAAAWLAVWCWHSPELSASSARRSSWPAISPYGPDDLAYDL